MTTTTDVELPMTQQLADLLRELHRQDSAYITASVGMEGVMRAFRNGGTIDALSRMHPLFDRSKGRIFPLDSEDAFELQHAGAPIPAVALEEGTLAANIMTLAALWRIITSRSLDLYSWCEHYRMFRNALTDVIVNHPDYDMDSGQIR